MAVTNFTNISDFTGDFMGESGVIATSNIVETSIVNGITPTKSADKSYWVSGPLSYTISLNNASGSAFENIVMTDQLDALITLDEDYGVYIGSVKTENYTFAAGLLTVPIGDVEDGENVTVTFHVLRV